jgi:uncharacterized protein
MTTDARRADAHRPLDDAERERLESLLDAVPAPSEPLDTGALDGFLCGVIVQPRAVPEARWLPRVTDVDARALPHGCDARELHALVRRRHAELAEAIARRAWFDPWVYELEDASVREAVLPWVAGFATALELFPALLRSAPPAALEPLALIYRHLDRDDLDDAEELLDAIDRLEPVDDLADAVEDLVRATLLLADAALGRSGAPRAPPAGQPRPRRRAGR